MVFLAGDDDVLKLTWLQGQPSLAFRVAMAKSWGGALEVDPKCGRAGPQSKTFQSQCVSSHNLLEHFGFLPIPPEQTKCYYGLFRITF